MKDRVTEDRVAAFRLRRHHLLERAAHKDLAQVASDACGIQAQLSSAARLGFWSRVMDLKPTDVDDALWAKRTLVKTWAMRGTSHLLRAEDLPVYVGGLQREGLLREKQWMTRYGLKEEDFPRMSRAIEQALASGPTTRKDLAGAVAGLVGEWGRPWIEHVYGGAVRLACLEGRVCFGPDRGREVTFVRADQWLPSWEGLPQEEAEASLLRRYLRVFGPAMPQDYAAWSGMRIGAVKEIWKRLRPELVEVSMVGRKVYILVDDEERLGRAAMPSAAVRLLPHFDGYLLGHKDKNHLVSEDHYKQVYRKAGWISPTLLVNGRAAGTWDIRRRVPQIELTVSPFERLSPEVEDALETEVEKLARFYGAPIEVVLGGTS